MSRSSRAAGEQARGRRASIGVSGRALARRVVLLAAFAALAAGLWGGLARLDGSWGRVGSALAGVHGPLMVAGFMGTVIALERAVALGRRWPYLAPAANAAGSVALILGASRPWAGAALTLGAIIMVLMFAVMLARRPGLYVSAMGAGALALALGNALWWRGTAVPTVLPLWFGFLVLTIGGERLELSRIQRSKRRPKGFLAAALAICAGMALSFWDTQLAWIVVGSGAAALALWLWRSDVARRTRRASGLARYIAHALLLGYFWLLFGGGLAVLYGGEAAGVRYEAFVHSLFLGFAFGMIMAHAPMILPAVVGGNALFHPVLYVPLLLLHGSLVLRVASGLVGWMGIREVGAEANVAAVLMFLAAIAWSRASSAEAEG